MPRRKQDAPEAPLAGHLAPGTAAALKAASGKDGLAKVLKAAAGALEQAPQDAGALGGELPPLASALSARAITQHADADVRLVAAYCLTHVLRIYAPEVPYDDAKLEVVGVGGRAAGGRRARRRWARGVECSLPARRMAADAPARLDQGAPARPPPPPPAVAAATHAPARPITGGRACARAGGAGPAVVGHEAPAADAGPGGADAAVHPAGALGPAAQRAGRGALASLACTQCRQPRAGARGWSQRRGPGGEGGGGGMLRVAEQVQRPLPPRRACSPPPPGRPPQTKLYYLLFDRFPESYIMEWVTGLLSVIQ
jgi:hypothetical protein